jgi:sterol desaturase/sphingolipid hydroxylase (fatty acid hydroxylase superfamily)
MRELSANIYRPSVMNRVALAIAELKSLGAHGKPPQTFWQFTFGFVVALSLLAALFWMLERWFPEDAGQRPVSWANTRPGARLDFIYWWIGHFADKAIGIFVIPAALIAILLRLPHFQTILASQPVPLQIIELLLAADLTGYWTHRALHHYRPLWRLHSVHHSSKRLDWLAGGRVHPAESLIGKLVQVSVIFWLGFSPAVISVFSPLFGIYAIFLHANVRWDFGPFRWILASPAYHRWHHSAEPAALNKNFAGLFPMIDVIFGTAYFPESRPSAYGLAEERLPESLWGQLTGPLQKI